MQRKLSIVPSPGTEIYFPKIGILGAVNALLYLDESVVNVDHANSDAVLLKATEDNGFAEDLMVWEHLI